MTNVVPVNQARRHLGELIQKAHYAGMPFVLTHHDKPMVAMISTDQFVKFLEWLEEEDQGLADTIAIMNNPEIQKILEQGEKDIAGGNVLPLDESILD